MTSTLCFLLDNNLCTLYYLPEHLDAGDNLTKYVDRAGGSYFLALAVSSILPTLIRTVLSILGVPNQPVICMNFYVQVLIHLLSALTDAFIQTPPSANDDIKEEIADNVDKV